MRITTKMFFLKKQELSLYGEISIRTVLVLKGTVSIPAGFWYNGSIKTGRQCEYWRDAAHRKDGITADE